MKEFKEMSIDELIDLQQRINKQVKLLKEYNNNIPQPVENPDFVSLTKMTNDILLDIYKQEYNNEDNQHYIYEATLETIYGKNIFKWINNIC